MHLEPSEAVTRGVLSEKVFLLKKRLWHRCFPVNFAKFLRTSVLQNTSGRLLLEPSEAANVFLKISQNSQEKHCVRVPLLKKETMAEVFSYEFCEIFRNTIFTEHLRVTASESCQRSMMEVLVKLVHTAQKIKFSILDFFSKCEQVRSFLLNATTPRITFFFCRVYCSYFQRSTNTE